MNSPNDKSNSGWYKSLCRYINSINSVKSDTDQNLGDLSNSDCTKPKSPVKDSKKNFAYLTPKIERLSDGQFKDSQPCLDYKSVFKSNTRKRQFLTSPSESKTCMDRKWLKLDEEISQDYVHVDTPHPFVKNSRLLDHSKDVEENNIKIKLLEEEKDLLRRSISHIIHEEVKKIADLDDRGPFGCLSRKASPSMFAYTASNRTMNERKSLFTPTRAHLLATNVSKTGFSRWNKPLKLNGRSNTENIEKDSEKVEEKKPAKRKNVFSANFDDDGVYESKVFKKDTVEDPVVLVQKPKVTSLAYTFSSPLNRGPLCSKCKAPVESKEIVDVGNLSKNEDKNSDSEVSAASSPDYSKEVTTEAAFPSKATSNLWSCQACYVNNSNDRNECDCCKTPKGEVLPVSVPSKDWTCPDCMVKNKETDLKCVCCTAMKPGAKTNTSSVENKKWTCNICLVPNEADKSNCVCCAAPKIPSKTLENKPEPKILKPTKFVPTTGNFSFGFSASSTNSSENNSTVFGTTPKMATNIFGNADNENKTTEKDIDKNGTNVPIFNANGLTDDKVENKQKQNFSFGFKAADATSNILTSSEVKTKNNTSTIFGSSLSSQDLGASSVVVSPTINDSSEIKITPPLFDNSTKNSAPTNSLFTSSFKQTEPSATSIFGTPKGNDLSAETIFGTTKPIETGGISLFGSNISTQPNNLSVNDSSKQSLFSIDKKNEVGPTSLFGIKPDGNNSTLSLFGSSSQQTVNSNNQLSLFNSGGNNGTASSSGLFGQNTSSSGTTNSLFQPSCPQSLTNNVPSNPFGSSSSTNNSTKTCTFGSSASATQPLSSFNFGSTETVQKNSSVGFNFGLPAQNNSVIIGNPNEVKGFDFGSAPQSFDFSNRSSSFQFGSSNPVANVFLSSPASSAAPSPIVGRRIAQAKRKGVRKI